MGPESVTRRYSTALGRSGPRSKSGCQTCRARRVRCDEKRPGCGHCDRLKLDCVYQPPQPRQRRQRTRASTRSTTDGSPTSATSPGLGRGTRHEQSVSASDNAELPYEGLTAANEEQGSSSNTVPLMMTQSQDGTSTSHHITRQSDDQYVLDSIDCLPSDGTNLTGAAAGIADFGQTQHHKSTWHSGAFNDYLPLPDPTFPFTSLGFTNSLDFFDPEQATDPAFGSAEGPHAWRNDVTDMGMFSSDPSALQSLNNGGSNGGNDNVTTLMENSRSRRKSSRPTFAVSPPLLSPAQEDMLLAFFERDIRPPASLVGVDPLGWLKIKRYVLRMARDDNEVVMHSLFALSTLLSGSRLPIRLGTNRDDHRLFASRLQEAACAAIETELTQDDWPSRSSHSLLVSIFLLAWFETAFDENEDRPSFPTHLAEKIIVKGQSWNPGSAHLFQWLTLLDAKISHLGGRRLLSEPALQVVRESRPSLTHADLENEEDGDDAPQLAASVDMELSASKLASPSSKTPAAGRLAYLLSSGTPLSLPSNVIRMDIFNILLQPAFEFHMSSQAYSRRIGCHDRHHRPRGTPEDEMEVMNVCMDFEGELQELWRRRPGILNLDASQLRDFVSEGIAKRLEQLFSVYIATFWTHFIYIHRVAFWSLKHTPIALKALEQTGNMMRRSVGQSNHHHEFDESLPRTSSNSIHPGLMWACFMFGCEVSDSVQQEWCVLQLRALGKLPSTGADRQGGDGGDELLAFRLDEKGAQNALKASQLLAQLIERQSTAAERVDGKYLSQELFGCHFYII